MMLISGLIVVSIEYKLKQKLKAWYLLMMLISGLVVVSINDVDFWPCCGL